MAKTVKKSQKKQNRKTTKKRAANKLPLFLIVLLFMILGFSVLSFSLLSAPKFIKANDSSKSFSYEYPDDWSIKPYVWEYCCEGQPTNEPDWSKESKPITLHPNEDNDVTVTISAEKYGNYWNSYNDIVTSVKEDYFAKILYEGTRKDGHKALFSRVDYLGPPDAKVESFTDHRYYFDNNDSVLKVEFREKYHHDWPDEETGPDIDNSKYVSDFEHIAQSIIFTN